jgi:trk system potassium uptake protein TrkH
MMIAQTRLRMAHLVGAVAAGVLMQFAVSMPDDYFGPSDHITRFGIAYSGASVLALVVTLLSVAQRRRWATLATATILAANVVVFIPPLAANPVTAGLVVVWNFYLLSRVLLGIAEPRAFRRGEVVQPDDTLEDWLRTNGPAVRHLLVVALVATVGVVGYGIGSKAPAQAVCLVLQVLAAVAGIGFLRRLYRHRRWAAVTPIIFLIAALGTAMHSAVALAVLAAFDLTVLVLIATQSALFAEILHHFYGRPALLILVSFVVLIGLGTLLLTFPAASANTQPVTTIDALFTATSASCVTGLIVLDTPRDFSIFGQFVILILIQAGGLNIMVLSTFAALLLGRGIGLRGEKALGAMLDLPSISAAYRLITFIVIGTVTVEAVGAAVLSLAELKRGTPLLPAIWRGGFHAVSAFCNAGFALYSDSMVGFQDQPLVLLVVAVLITLGGLGFAVLAFTWLRLRSNSHVSLATQVRIVLLASLALTVVGFAVVAVVEWDHGLAALNTSDKLVNALFQSVTCRTAGFNSVALDGLHPVTWLLFMALMFVGASPGGTGGGIKTTTLVVLLSAIPAIASGRHKVVLLRRSISLDTVYRSTVIAVVATLIILFGFAALLAIQDQSFAALIFETVSAFGTVGLSLGATAALASPGKLVVIVVMFVGRIGPLSLALLLGRERPSSIGYPEAKIMVG